MFYDSVPYGQSWQHEARQTQRVIHVSELLIVVDQAVFLFCVEFQVPVAVGESDDGNDLQCVDPRAKLEEINNFNVTYSQLCLVEH